MAWHPLQYIHAYIHIRIDSQPPTPSLLAKPEVWIQNRWKLKIQNNDDKDKDRWSMTKIIHDPADDRDRWHIWNTSFQSVTYLQQSVFDFDVEQTEVFKVSRRRVGEVLVLANHVCQTCKHWFGRKRQTFSDFIIKNKQIERKLHKATSEKDPNWQITQFRSSKFWGEVVYSY